MRLSICRWYMGNSGLNLRLPEQLSRYSDSLQAGRSGVRTSRKVRFSGPIQTSSEVDPAFCTKGTGVSFPGVKRPGRGVYHSLPNQRRVCVDRAIRLAPFYAYLASYRIASTFHSTGLLPSPKTTARQGSKFSNIRCYVSLLSKHPGTDTGFSKK
jgi:hypothetical protein